MAEAGVPDVDPLEVEKTCFLEGVAWEDLEPVSGNIEDLGLPVNPIRKRVKVLVLTLNLKRDGN